MLTSLLLLAACGGAPEAPAVVVPRPLTRQAFNAHAAVLGLPVAQNHDGELVAYWSTLPFDGDLTAATERIEAGPPGVHGTPDEVARREGVRVELSASAVTLLETDLRGSPDQAMIRHLVDAAGIIETLFALQRGTSELASRVPPDDSASQALFARNQHPACVTGRGRELDACSAIPGDATFVSGLYPAAVQEKGFCERLLKGHPDVMQPFVVARQEAAGLTPVPYPQAWPDQMSAAASSLRAAAEVAPDDEGAMMAYLLAAAKAFEDNDWFAADTAWAAMNQGNSRWYLRVGPDEVYEDPCGQHAGFALTLARVNPEGLHYQRLLQPVKQDMETLLAQVSGPPYEARTVGFHLPEFIDITLNAGDSRSPSGATVGQSLPNWGPVSDAGGRTVAMTNIGTDPDSLAGDKVFFSSIFCEDTYARWPSHPEPQLYSTILHEAAHNLGPSGEYAVDGRTDATLFGGPVASVLEELKCQTAALYLAHRLPALGVKGPADPTTLNLGDIAYAIGKLSDGMYTEDGGTNAYAQLAAIQLGYLTDKGVLTWLPERVAADGETTGCVAIDAEGLPAAVDAMATEVFEIKSQGDVPRAQALIDTYVRDTGQHLALRDVMVERAKKGTSSTYVYRVILD